MRKTFDNWAATNRCDVGSDLTWLTQSSSVTQQLHWLFCDCCSLKRLISLQPVYKTLGHMLWYFLGLSSTIIRILKKIFESILVSNKTNIWKNLCWSEVCFVTTVRVKFVRWQTGQWGWNRRPGDTGRIESITDEADSGASVRWRRVRCAFDSLRHLIVWKVRKFQQLNTNLRTAFYSRHLKLQCVRFK